MSVKSGEEAVIVGSGKLYDIEVIAAFDLSISADLRISCRRKTIARN